MPETAKKKQPTLAQRRAWNKSKNNPSPAQKRARREFAKMSKQRARLARQKKSGGGVTRRSTARRAQSRTNPLRFRSEKDFQTWRAKTGSKKKSSKRRGGKRKGVLRGLGSAIRSGLRTQAGVAALSRRGNKSVSRRLRKSPGQSRNGTLLSGKSRGNRKPGQSRNASSDVRSPTRTEVRSPTRTATSTEALTSGNVTVTGGAGRGATTRVEIHPPATRKTKGVVGRANPGARTRRRNQLAVKKLFEGFAGRQSVKSFPGDAPNNTPDHVALLGVLVCLKATEETFRFAESENVCLAADARGNLYVVGGHDPVEPKHDFGPLLAVSYVCAKTHLEGGKVVEYVHKFGDDGGALPRLRSDSEGQFRITGGAYTITPEGIAD